MNNTNTKLLAYIQHIPEVYEESSSAFWDDEHIAKQMLDAHLSQEHEGASRKLEYIQLSVNWITTLCNKATSTSILDLGCGPGLYAQRFYDKGYNVTGIDFSKRSIAYAKQQAKLTKRNITYCYQNYLEMDYDNEFDMIVLIYCDLGVLSKEQRYVLLTKVYRALKRNGIFIFDVFSEQAFADFEEKETFLYEDQGFWLARPYALLQRNIKYKTSMNILEQYIVIDEEDCKLYNIWNQMYTSEQLQEEIHNAGFNNTQVFGNVCGKSYRKEDNTICMVAHKK